MSSWTGIDFFIFLILLLNTLMGMSRGATREIVATMCWIAALVVTIKFTLPVMKFINSSPLITTVIATPMVQRFMQQMGLPPLTEQMLLNLNYCISLLVCFMSVIAASGVIVSMSNIVEVFPFPYQFLNRKLGTALGAMRGFVFTLIFIVLLQHLFMGNVPASYFINLFQGSAQKLDNLITAQAPERYREILEDRNLYNEQNILNELKNPT